MERSCLLIVCLLVSAAWSKPQNDNKIPDDQFFESRLIGGTAAVLTDATYVVSISGKDYAGQDVDPCGGAIIQANMVLTTAFCVLNTASGSVTGGSITLADSASPAETVKILSVLVHPEFRKNTMENDIAIVKVKPAFDLTKTNIKAITIAPAKYVDNNALKNPVNIFGWGISDASLSSKFSTTLNTLPLPVGKDKDCATVLKANYFKMPVSSICLNATSTKTACTGDLGSPVSAIGLDTKKPADVSLVGLISRWVSCPNTKNVPIIMTKLSPFFKWITANNGPTVT